MSTPENVSEIPKHAGFTGTHWSVVLAAVDSNPAVAQQALSTLCRTYWYPLYAFVRRSGRSIEDAEDLTQSFFERLLARDLIREVTPERGRFRTFLLVCLKNHLIHEREKSGAQKRGGNRPVFSLEENLEERHFPEPSDRHTPEKLYCRDWALTLLEEVLKELESEYRKAGQASQFEALKPVLAGGKLSYETVAALFSTTSGSVRVWVHRLKKRYQEQLRARIEQTVDSPAEVEDELRFLLASISS